MPWDKNKKKDSLPLRYIGLRLLKTQGSLFADGSDGRHHARVTNLDREGQRFKTFRLMLVYICRRMSRFGCVLRPRFCAIKLWIDRFLKVGEVFELPT